MMCIKKQLLSTFIFVFSLMISFAFSPTTKAQSEGNVSTKPSFWIQAGPTITTLGLGFNAGVNAQIRNHYFTLKTNSTEISYWDETWDISFIYGRYAKTQNFKFYAGTGLSVLGGTSYTSLFETSKNETFGPVIGFPIEGSIFWHPVRFIGLGLNIFANVNTEQPFGGFGIALRAGYFNPSY